MVERDLKWLPLIGHEMSLDSLLEEWTMQLKKKFDFYGWMD